MTRQRLPHPPEVRARVIAEWQLGKAKMAIARDLGVSRGYVQSVTRGLTNQAVLSPEKRVDLGELVFEYLEAGLLALIAQAREAATSSLIREQGASLYLLHGTLADKLIAIIRGVEDAKLTEPQPARLLPARDARLSDSGPYPDDDH